MSMIGDYVHFHKINYIKYGTNKVGRSSPDSNRMKSIPTISNMNKSEIQSLIKEANFLEEQYNKLFYPKRSEVNNKSKYFKKQLKNFIQKKLDEEFGSVAGSFNADNLSVDKTSLYTELSNAIRITKDRLGMAIISKNATASNLLRQTELMYNILNQQEFRSIVEIKSRIEDTKERLNNIKNNLLKEIELNGKSIKITNIEDIQSLQNIIQEFNRIPLLYKQNKIVFEWLVPFIKIQSATTARKQLASFMKTLISNNVSVTIDQEEEEEGKDVNIKYNDVNIETFSVDNSTKIVIEYKDSQQVTQQSNVIAKNIRSKLQIQLLNKESLYSLLVLSNTYNFANHYLNIVASAEGQTSEESDILEANRILKGSILGATINNYSGINFLIMNDYSKRRIYVYSIKVLLYIIQESLLSGSNRYSNIINLENNYTIPNDFQDIVKHRIANIINTIKNKRISSTIDQTMFNAYKNSLIRGKT